MTVCGFHKAGGGLAFAWADGEAYWEGGAPAGEAKKLGVSPGGIVGVGTGDKSVIEHFVDSVEWVARASFRESVAWLRAELLDVSSRKRAYFEKHGVGTRRPKSVVAAVVFESGGFRGVVMREANGFVPQEADAWASPGFDAAPPRNSQDVLGIAVKQMNVLRREIPLATGRTLEIAKIGPRGVARARVPLSAADFS